MLCFDLHHNIDSKHKLSQRMLCFALPHNIDQRRTRHYECFYLPLNYWPRLLTVTVKAPDLLPLGILEFTSSSRHVRKALFVPIVTIPSALFLTVLVFTLCHLLACCCLFACPCLVGNSRILLSSLVSTASGCFLLLTPCFVGHPVQFLNY